MAHLRTVVTLAALLATLPSAAPVADVAILGPPNNSCGSWLSYRRAQGGADAMADRAVGCRIPFRNGGQAIRQ